MRSLLLAFAAAALALLASNARADDVEYPDQNVVFTTATSPEPIVTPDVTYPGPHAVLYKDAPGPGRSSVASFDDVRYDDGASLGAKASPAREERPDCRVARQDISCPHHG
jgi:hypothetical protein